MEKASLQKQNNTKAIVSESLFERAFYEANKIKLVERENIYAKKRRQV